MKHLIQSINRDELLAAFTALTNRGLTEEQAVAELAGVVDALLPLGTIVPAPWGQLLEAADGLLARLIVRGALRLARKAAEKAAK